MPVRLPENSTDDPNQQLQLALDDDPVSIESLDNFPTKELAQEQVNYELQASSLRIAEVEGLWNSVLGFVGRSWWTITLNGLVSAA